MWSTVFFIACRQLRKKNLAMGDKLNTNNSADNRPNLGHFFKATDFDDIAIKVKIMKIILNISPYFVLAFLTEIVVMKRFVSVTACLIHNNYQSESTSQQTRGIHPMLVQCWASVEDSGPTLKHHWMKSPVFARWWTNVAAICPI